MIVPILHKCKLNLRETRQLTSSYSPTRDSAQKQFQGKKSKIKEKSLKSVAIIQERDH